MRSDARINVRAMRKGMLEGMASHPAAACGASVKAAQAGAGSWPGC
jgi:hypothetical protein